jgi:hypothetical protein
MDAPFYIFNESMNVGLGIHDLQTQFCEVLLMK